MGPSIQGNPDLQKEDLVRWRRKAARQGAQHNQRLRGGLPRSQRSWDRFSPRGQKAQGLLVFLVFSHREGEKSKGTRHPSEKGLGAEF